MNERFKELRKEMNKTQEEFGKMLGITKSGVSEIESGRRKVTDQHIIMLTRFGINEEWIRTGNGPMFAEKSLEEKLTAWADNALKGNDAVFKRRFVNMMMNLSENEWEVLEKRARQLLDKQDGNSGRTIDQKVEEYRRQLEEEEASGGRSSVSNTTEGSEDRLDA